MPTRSARMGRDAASQRVRADMARWGVHCGLDQVRPHHPHTHRRSGDSTRTGWTAPAPILLVLPALRRGASALQGDYGQLGGEDQAGTSECVRVLFRSPVTCEPGLGCRGIGSRCRSRVRTVQRCHRQTDGGGASSRSCRQVRGRSPCRPQWQNGGRLYSTSRSENPWGRRSALSPSVRPQHLPTGCTSVPFLYRDLPIPAALATGARRASSRRLRSMDTKGCAAPALVACGRHYGTDRCSQRGIAASRVRGAACTLLRVKHSRLRLRACRTADSKPSRRIRTEANRHRL